MIARGRSAEHPTVPMPTPALPWALTGWGVAVLGVGFALGLAAVAAVLAPIVVVVWP